MKQRPAPGRVAVMAGMDSARAAAARGEDPIGDIAGEVHHDSFLYTRLRRCVK